MKLIASILLVAVLATGCKKEAVKLPEPDFTLELNKETVLGIRYTMVDNGLNTPGVATAVARYSIKNTNIEVNLGITPNDHVPQRMHLQLVFPGTTNPAAIAGTYRLPVDQQKIKLKLTEKIENGVVEREQVLDGEIAIRYDDKTRKLSGELRSIRFAIPPASTYVNVSLNGWFNHAAAE